MDTMNADLAAKILEIKDQASAHMRRVEELGLPYRARIAAQAGIERAANVDIANAALDAGVAQEPDLSGDMPEAAVRGLYDQAVEEIAKAALSAAMVAVAQPLMPTDADI